MSLSESAGIRADQPDLLALDNQVCFALAISARSVIALYKPLLDPLSLTHPQYLVMLALWEHAPRSVRELGETLALEPATLSPVLKRLERVGYITRTRSEHDERMLQITLTDSGAALREQALRIPSAMMERLGLPAEQLARTRDLLHALIDAAR